MANIAQTINVLQCLIQTDEEAAWATPTYHVFDLYKRHLGETAVRTVIDTDVREVESEDNDVPLISASASKNNEGLFVTLTNRALEERRVVIDIGQEIDGDRSAASVLFDDMEPEAHSTRENADEFAIQSHGLETDSEKVAVEIPPSSIMSVDVRS